MKIIPIEFSISSEELVNKTPEDVETSIKDEILKCIIEAIAPMLNDEGFIEMTPSEDESEFNIKISMLIGSSNEYIEATSETTTNLMKLCLEHGTDQNESIQIISKATLPLVELIS